MAVFVNPALLRPSVAGDRRRRRRPPGRAVPQWIAAAMIVAASYPLFQQHVGRYSGSRYSGSRA